MPTCPACAQENPEVARFCLACGHGLGEPTAPSEERRVVSVVFVDLVGFTSAAEQMDPEDVRAVLAPYYNRVRTELESFGGKVEKFIGDAVMGVFGAPTTYGDDPERAVRAALAARDAVLAAEPDASTGQLAVRVAVNTGDALVSLGAQLDTGQAMLAGDVVNTAARLQQSAPVNGVIVGTETHRCTKHVIRYEPMDPVTAKGKAAPVDCWLAIAPITEPGDRPQTVAAFVGRERETRLLEETWRRATVDRAPQLVTIFGPPGVGKTRLGLEFSQLVADDGGTTMRGRSLPYRESSAYGAFADQVKNYAGIFASDAPDVVMKKLHEATDALLGEQADTAVEHLGVLLGVTPEHEVADRESLFFSVRCFVEAIARQGPTLLVFEDIHWADESLLDLVELLAARVHDLPLLILTLARPELLDARPAWARGLVSYMSVPLEPLAAAEAQALARLLLETVQARTEDTRAAELAETAEGNPLFIEQLAAAVTERSAKEAALPTTIRGTVAARLDALPAQERSVLLAASVIGRVFWRGALDLLIDGVELQQVLGALEARDLIRRETTSLLKGEQQYAFKHVLIRDSAYETLPRKRRQEMHAIVAEFLASTATPTGEAGAALARHWRSAGRPDKALSYLEAAAEQAARGWAKGHAFELYGEALKCVSPDDTETLRRLRQRQAVMWQAAMHVRDALQLGRSAQADDEPAG
jgi:class 3 adenylate cyclase